MSNNESTNTNEIAEAIRAAETQFSKVLLEKWGVDTEIVEDLGNRLNKYESSYNNPEARLEKLTRNPVYLHEGKAIVPYWLGSTHESGAGDCVDLATDLMFELETFGYSDDLREVGVNTVFCQGHDPKFFNDAEDNHVFVALARKDFEDEEGYKPENVIILDPALQRFVLYPISGYSIKETNSNPERIELDMNREVSIVDVDEINNLKGKEVNTLVVGLSEQRDYVISLGFVSKGDQVKPYLKLIDDQGNVGRAYLGFEEDTLITHFDKLTGQFSKDPSQVEDLLHVMDGIEFKPAEAVEDEILDENGVSLRNTYRKTLMQKN